MKVVVCSDERIRGEGQYRHQSDGKDQPQSQPRDYDLSPAVGLDEVDLVHHESDGRQHCSSLDRANRGAR